VSDARTPRRLLILGSSSTTFADEGGSLPDLLEEAMARRDPEAPWEARSVIAYPRPNMLERALEAVDRFRPDIVLLLLAGNVFAEESVMFSLYHHHRWLYRPMSQLIGAAKKGAGGGGEGSHSARGLLFRLPRAAARRVFGMASLIDLEAALASTFETLEALSNAGPPLLCRLAIPSVQQKEQTTAVEARVRHYNDLVSARCERLRIPWFEAIEELARCGHSYRNAPDALHMDLETRQAVAELCAGLLLPLAAQRSAPLHAAE
jgi:hypothetical protein